MAAVGKSRTCDWRRAAEVLLAAAAILVIDGDTVMMDGERWRLTGLDAPEIHSAKCAQERQLGIVAAARLIRLLAERGGELVPETGRRRDKFGRRLGRLLVGGEEWSALAIGEGLAVPYDGRGPRGDWCGPGS